MGILRTIGMGLCSMIYPLIKTFYTLFYQIARAKFLSEDTINSLSNNIYILISVVMLFSLGVQLLRSIVNPDLLLDNKKGTTAIVKRVFLSLCLIILIPMVFSYSFVIQDKIISSNVIEKLIVGYNSDKSLGDSNAGQIFAGLALNTVFYPQAESSSVEGLAEDYNKMINDDIGLISDVGDYVNEKTDEDSNSDNYVFYFNGLIAIIAGIFILYMLVLYCMDVGLRLVKLSFLQLTAPISIMAYIATGKDSLEKWFKEVLSTYLGLFVKIGALAFMLFAMGHIDEITGSFGDNDKWVKLFVLIGLLQFVHSAPDLILKLFGVKIGGRGGIRGRLGEMAAVGNLAQRGWDMVRRGAPAAALMAGAGIAAGAGALGNGAGRLGRFVDNRFLGGRVGDGLDRLRTGVNDRVSRVRDSRFGQGAGRLGSNVASAGRVLRSGATSQNGNMIHDMRETARAEFGDNRATNRAIRQNERNARIAQRSADLFTGESGVNNQNGNLHTYYDPNDGKFKIGTVDSNGNLNTSGAKLNNNLDYSSQTIGNDIDSNNRIAKDRFAHARSMADRDRIRQNIYNDRNINHDEMNAVATLSDANGNKISANEIKENHDKVVTSLQGLNNVDSSELISTFNSGNTLSLQNKLLDLKSEGKIGENIYSDILKQIGQFNSSFDNLSGSLDLNSKDIGSINRVNNSMNEAYDKAKTDFDSFAETRSESAKQEMQRLLDNSEKLQTQYAKEAANASFYDKDSNGNYNAYIQERINSANNPQPSQQQVQNNQQQTTTQSNNNGGNNSQTNANSTNMDGATINVQNLNAQNINAGSVNGNLNANRIDAQNLTGNSENVDADTTNAIRDAIERGISGADINAQVNELEQNATENYNNQNTDDTYLNGRFDSSAQKAPEEQIYDRTDFDDVFDQFYDQDDDE